MSTAHTPNAFEQELLELTNRARLSPQGEFNALISNAASGQGVQQNITDALSFFGVNLASLQSQLSGASAVAPLAWNGTLGVAADAHTDLMITFDSQSHRLPGEPALSTRIANAGYTDWTRVAENIFAFSEDPTHTHAGFYIDWGYDNVDTVGGTVLPNFASLGDGIQDPAGHRINILSSAVTEVGMSAVQENVASTSVGPWVVTQNFADRQSYVPQLLGVVIADVDGDDFYDQGEGLGGVTITATGAPGTFTTTSWAAGGYQMVLPAGSYTVTASGGALTSPQTYSVTMGSQNQKLDVVQAASSVLSGTAGGDALALTEPGRVEGLAGADTITGSSGDDILAGETTPLVALTGWGDDVYRLYGATLGREPDAGGYTNWVTSLASGAQTLNAAAQGFVASPEFQNTYGALNNTAFVTLLYANVLGRMPDATGLANWVASLEGGNSRSSVVLGFSQSTEYQNNTAAAAKAYADGLDAATWSGAVYRLYQATLGREPDAGGFAGWTANLAGGQSLASVANAFVASQEFQNTYGALDNTAFVTLLYANVLNRPPDAAGLANWVAALNGGMSRADVVLGFSESTEFQNNTKTALTAYMQGLGGGDRIDGGAGDDVISGGLYADVFVFGPNDGSDRVVDFEPWDQVDLSQMGYASGAEALTHASQSGSNVVFAHQGTTVLFEDALLSDFGNALLV